MRPSWLQPSTDEHLIRIISDITESLIQFRAAVPVHWTISKWHVDMNPFRICHEHDTRSAIINSQLYHCLRSAYAQRLIRSFAMRHNNNANEKWVEHRNCIVYKLAESAATEKKTQKRSNRIAETERWTSNQQYELQRPKYENDECECCMNADNLFCIFGYSLLFVRRRMLCHVAIFNSMFNWIIMWPSVTRRDDFTEATVGGTNENRLTRNETVSTFEKIIRSSTIVW